MSDLVQGSLLEQPTIADHVLAPTPGQVHRTDPHTSTTGARKIALRAGALKHRILAELVRAGDEGANDWELHERCDPNGRVHSAATRRKELMDEYDPPLVAVTETSRPTDSDDCEGLVHVITDAGRAALAEIEEAVAHG